MSEFMGKFMSLSQFGPLSNLRTIALLPTMLILKGISTRRYRSLCCIIFYHNRCVNVKPFFTRTLASQKRWEKMEGSLNLITLPKHVVFYLRAPSWCGLAHRFNHCLLQGIAVDPLLSYL
jgi:hypothetical protein